MSDTETVQTPAKKLLTVKKITRMSGKLAIAESGDELPHSKFAMKVLRQIANGAENPQKLARAFFKGAKKAKKTSQTAQD